MIAKEMEAKILRLHLVERWPIGTIAAQLGIHHGTVRRVLAQGGVEKARRLNGASILDPFMPFMEATLEKYPRVPAIRLFQMVRNRGYHGGPDHFRHVVARIRPRKAAEAFHRLRTLPGEQVQADWAHFGKIRIGRAERPLMGFVMVLSWSREIFLRFFLSQRMPCFLQGHVEAFERFGGVSRTCLYDNLKSVVLERIGDAVRFHPTALELAAHYRYEPRPVAVARGNEKGRVERAIRYVRSSFFVARKWKDLGDLNRQAREWSEGLARDRRCPGDTTMTVGEAFRQEKEHLLPLPATPFPTEERVEASVGKQPYATFDLNDYSVPHQKVRRTLTVLATEETVRILDGNEVVATHPRSYDKWQQVEDPAHLAELTDWKRAAKRHRGMNRLHSAVPSTGELYRQAAQQGGNLGALTNGLLRLLELFGKTDLEKAVAKAVAHGRPHLPAIRQVLNELEDAKEAFPALPVKLPDDPRVRNLVVTPHPLQSYDKLGGGDPHETE